MMNISQQIDYFYDLSAELTGYNLVVLYGTGQGDFYLQSLREILGESFVSDLLNAYQSLGTDGQKDPAKKLMEMEKYEPVCRNIIKMWYLGTWTQLTAEWRAKYVSSTLDTSRVLSKDSYIEGLVWKAMDRHPQSAKQPGYGTWAFEPLQG